VTTTFEKVIGEWIATSLLYNEIFKKTFRVFFFGALPTQDKVIVFRFICRAPRQGLLCLDSFVEYTSLMGFGP
jgi:hypothetical protein